MKIYLPYPNKNQQQSGIVYGHIILLAFMTLILFACSSKKEASKESIKPEIINVKLGEGNALELEFIKGAAHNHPLMAVWTGDAEGNYIETLFVAKSIGTGLFEHGKINEGHWEPGPISRPAALPYWWHQFGHLPTPEDPAADAITGATPKASFILNAQVADDYPETFTVFLEVNQSWDWNEYWTNVLYPENEAYMASSQPALVYRATINQSQSDDKSFILDLIGHSHYAGEDGELYTDTSTLSTAKEIAAEIRVRLLSNTP